jgi:predicted amidohydrolase
MSNVSIAATQMPIEHFAVDANIKKAMADLQKAHRGDADFACFPEGFLTGFVDGAYARQHAQSVDGPIVNSFAKAAQEYGIYVIMGSFFERDGTDIYNTSVLISPNGPRQVQEDLLVAPEKPYTRRGSELPVFETKFGKVGIQICWDLAFPEITRTLALKGATMVFCPSFWLREDNALLSKYTIDTEGRFIDSCSQSRAMENQVVVVFVNSGGRRLWNGPRQTFAGHTQITMPFYGCLGRLSAFTSGMLQRDVDLSVCDDAQGVYKVLDDVREVTKSKPLACFA